MTDRKASTQSLIALAFACLSLAILATACGNRVGRPTAAAESIHPNLVSAVSSLHIPAGTHQNLTHRAGDSVRERQAEETQDGENDAAPDRDNLQEGPGQFDKDYP